MNNQFYTMGGGHFWEDVFFYQKWRIQRNYITKRCRLLDNWDIRRHEGTFEECRKAFIKYIEIYELGRQKGHMVVMLHGLGQSKNVFKPLWRIVLQNNMMAAAINYPSTQKNIESHARQIDFFLNHLLDVEKVSFVTYGLGGILLQVLLNRDSDWKKHLKIGRIVEISPPNHGDRLLFKLSGNKISEFILGPVSREMGQRRIESIPPLPKNIEFGIIRSSSWWNKYFRKLTKTENLQLSAQEEKRFSNAKEVIDIPDNHWNIFDNEKITGSIINFLVKGKF